MKFLATCPQGLEALLVDELIALGATDVKPTGTGAEFYGEIEHAYRACLWSRVANRILVPVAESVVETADDLYDAVRSVDWMAHLPHEAASLSVAFTGKTNAINHTHFGALKVKDAIVDQVREKTGGRPNIDRDNPDLRVHAHIYRGRLSLSVDLSGESLHRRGYRTQAGAAPLKENLAAGILYRAKWLDVMQERPVFFDPMCGSGTLVIEAVMMAADIAPGILRASYGFERWKQHQPELWASIKAEAEHRKQQGLANLSARFYGADQDKKVLEVAQANAERAGVAQHINFKVARVEQLVAPEDGCGLMVTNPPYGERLGEGSELMFLYRQIGDVLKQDFAGWQASIFTGNPELCQVVGLKPAKMYSLKNGPIDSKLYLYTLYADRKSSEQVVEEGEVKPLSETAQMFANRLKKNMKALKKWVAKESIECYRLYDADIPEYSVAVDIYKNWVHVQEYVAPHSIDKVKAFERLKEVMDAIPVTLNVDPKQVVLKQRKRQSGSGQYEKQASVGRFFEVGEYGCRLRVNLHDYLDTGLFLDHRPVRHQIQQMAAGKDFLNLFCYTASASVHAGVGGAKSTTSVDMSATYLQWAMKNMALNGFNDKQHHFIESDCFAWLKKQRRPAYDLIFMDPPTFSNSKKMVDVLDVQRDHVDLIKSAMRLLRKDGVLIFSNNYRKFKLDYELLAAFEIKEITSKTIDTDFARNPKIHCCFEIRWP